jgi:hypothetical protein
MARRSPADIHTASDWVSLTANERLARDRALEALSLMRYEGLSLDSAAQAAGTTPGTVLKYAGGALQRTASGEIRARPSDSLFRRMRVLVAGKGPREIDIPTSREASIIARHWNAVKHFLWTGDSRRLARFKGVTVAGRPLETDPDVIERLAGRGELDFEDIYELTT